MKITGSRVMLISSVLATMLLASVLVGLTSSQPSYDPWLDTNDDGRIDMRDIGDLARIFGTSGTPINKTELLLELLTRIDALEARVATLDTDVAGIKAEIDVMKADIATLGADLVVLDALLTELEARVTALEAGGPGFLETPAYDSGWRDITSLCGQFFNVTHSLNSTDIIVDITGKTTLDGGLHQRGFGTKYLPGWSGTFGGASSDIAYSMVQTADGGFTLVGNTYSYGDGTPTYANWYHVKTDWTGDIQWGRTHGGMYNEFAHSVIQTRDGGYAIVGQTYSYDVGGGDVWLIKTDWNGIAQWNKTYGGSNFDSAWSVIQTTDGGYALAGTTFSSFTSEDAYLIKTNSAGVVQWQKTYGGTLSDGSYGVIQTLDAGYVLVGYTYSFGAGASDVYLVKTDSSGNMVWGKTYGTTGYDFGNGVVKTSDGGYTIGCSGFVDLIKTDSNGIMVWSKDYGVATRSVAATVDEGYILACDTGVDPAGLLVKTDFNGSMQWSKSYSGFIYSAIQTADGGYACAGYKLDPFTGYADFRLEKTEIESGLTWTKSTADTITLYRGTTDAYWNYVRVRIWKIGNP